MRPLLLPAAAAAVSLTLAAAPAGVDAASPPDSVTDAAAADGAVTDRVGDATGTSAAAQDDPVGSGEELNGTFALTAGQCGDGAVTSGSYFRMQNQAGGYVGNGSSPCGDGTYTPLTPGSDGGLVTGAYQPNPDPAFDGSGNGLAARITEPQSFFGTDFSTATNPTDPQTGTAVPEPRIVHDGQGGLSGDVRAFAAAWNNQHFNQGAPKPDGSRPGGTAGPEGTYDPATGAFTLEWSSRIQGGPFNGFTGEWHLEGTFRPAESADDGTGEDGTEPDEGEPEAGEPDEGEPAEAEPSSAEQGDGQPAPSGTTGGDAAPAGTSGDGELPETGPGLPVGLGLALMAAAGLLAARRRPAEPARP